MTDDEIVDIIVSEIERDYRGVQFSLDDIVYITGMKKGTIASLLNRALKKLRKAMIPALMLFGGCATEKIVEVPIVPDDTLITIQGPVQNKTSVYYCYCDSSFLCVVPHDVSFYVKAPKVGCIECFYELFTSGTTFHQYTKSIIIRGN